MKFKIFISSVQKEFAKERKALAEFIRNDVLLSKFFTVFIFEETPAQNRSAQEVYLAEAAGCDVYLGLIGRDYGYEDEGELADQAIRFVMTHISNWVGTRSSGDTAEVPTKFELPYDAVKEAIVNAVCHRDYTSHESVQVMLFADRLEVWNAGRLPEGLTVEKLKGAHPSLPPNELLALPMYLKGYIEKSGTGTEDMIEKCRAWGLRDPVFNEDGDFRVVIWRRTTQETAQETTQETAQENLSDVSRLIVDLIRADATISRRIIAEKIGLSQDGVKYHLNLLKKKIGLRHEGPTKKGRWVIDAGNAKKKGGAV